MTLSTLLNDDILDLFFLEAEVYNKRRIRSGPNAQRIAEKQYEDDARERWLAKNTKQGDT